MPFTLLATAVGSLRNSGPAALNWLFLIESIVIITLVVFYFFFSSRIGGLLVSFVLRLFFWKKNNSYFEIGGFQFAPLGGRISFTDFRYISRNQSLRIVKGDLTWRYWYWRVRSEEDSPSESKLPCRIKLSIHGAEWFLYNRTPSYDAILQQLGVDLDNHPGVPPPGSPQSWDETGSQSPKVEEKGNPGSGRDDTAVDDSIEEVEAGAGTKIAKVATDWLREALPVDVRCKTGAIIMGNPSTANIVIAGFDSVDGTYSAVKSRSMFDLYKQVYRLNFHQPKIVFRTNPDYQGPMSKQGEEVLSRLEKDPEFDLQSFLDNPSLIATTEAFRALLRKLSRSPPPPPPKPTSPSSAPSPKWSWQGLPRYQSNSTDEDSGDPSTSLPNSAASHRLEYGKVTTLLTSPELEMTYYVDTVGKVPKVPRLLTGFAGLETCDVGNGDLSPEWGVDLVIKGGSITYGPWADRQRSEFQNAFTPTTFFTSKVTPVLKPGDDRMHTALKVFVEFSEAATLRIPTREASKDWKYDGWDSTSLMDEPIRPYGWLDVSLGPNSTLSYVMPMVATAQGFDTLVEFHLDEMSVSSSVNYSPFIQSQTCRIHLGLPSPLAWDAPRVWTINVTLAKPDVSLLRDHITLFTDVAKDWTSASGPPTADHYEQFVPFTYVINYSLLDYVLKLYLNDHNIINNFGNDEDNTLLLCRGPRLSGTATIPSNLYRMQCSTIPFSVVMSNVALSITLPAWNTNSAFLTDQTLTLATTPELTINGSYRFYASAHPDNVEELSLGIECSDVACKTMGWMIRHLFSLRDNYFGAFTHFVTLEEYRHRHERNIQGDPLERKYRPGATDVFEVHVTLTLKNGLMIMPEELFDCRAAVVFVLPLFQLDLRNHDYFMELALNVEPFRVVQTPDCDAFLLQDFASLMEFPDSIRVQGLEVTANRLFGPQPRTATYMCVWSFYLGSLVGSIPPSFLQACSRMGSALGRNFKDPDNTLPRDFEVALDPDATFLTLHLSSIDLSVRGAGTAIQLALPDGVKIFFDDLASVPFLKHINVEIPSLYVRFLAPLFGRAAPWMEVASVDADLSIVLGLSSTGWEKTAKIQRDFIESQDRITRRCPFIYGGEGPAVSSHVGGLFLPALAEPTKYTDGRRGSTGNPSRKADFAFRRGKGKESVGRRRDEEEEESDTDESDTSSEVSSTESNSDTSEDDYQTLYQRLPGRVEGGDRFSAYGAVLQLCERAPEAAFLDRPTFRRLAPHIDRASGDAFSEVEDRQVNSVEQRLAAFGTSKDRGPTDRTCIDLSSRRPIRVVLTPVAVQVGADVLASMPVDRDLENRLDELFVDYIGTKLSKRTTQFDSTEVAVSVPAIRIESIQDVLRPEDTISIKPRGDDQLPESTSTVLCTAQLSLEDVSIFYTQTDDAFSPPEPPTTASPPVVTERTLSASAGRTLLQVFPPSQPRVVPVPRRTHCLPTTKTRSRPTALDLTINLCELKLDFLPERALAAFYGGDAELAFVDEAAELVIGSLWSYRVVHDIAGPWAERALAHRQAGRELVWAIVEASNNVGITSSPTFLNRVSYLIGSSQTLRSDDGWQLLHHLRHRLRLATPEIEELLGGTVNSVPPWDQLSDVAAIASRWQSWETDAGELWRLPFLTSLFGSSSPSPRSLPTDAKSNGLAWNWDIPLDVEWRAGRVNAVLFDGHKSDNRLVIGPLDAFLSSPGRPASGEQLRLRSRFTLHRLEANVDRDVLLLVRHIINVRRTFERKIQLFHETIATLPVDPILPLSNDPLESDFLSLVPRMVVDVSFGIKLISGNALADNLEANATIQDVGASISIFVEPTISRSSRPLSHQINATTSLTLDHISLSAYEVKENQKVELLFSTDVEELSFVVNAVGSHVWNEGKQDEAPSLRVILAARSMAVRLPREAIRVYEFVDTWRMESMARYDSLLTELREGLDDIQANVTPKSSSSPSFSELLLAKTRIGIQVAVPLLTIEAQAIASLKLGYVLRDFAAHGRSTEQPLEGRAIGAFDAGLAIGSQMVHFISVSNPEMVTTPLTSETSFALPLVHLKARLDGIPCRHITLLVMFDSISVKLTAAIIDNLLTVQNRFGADIDELLRVIRTKHARYSSQNAPKPPISPPLRLPFAWDARIALRGFRVGLEGPQATQWIEADLLEGSARSSSDIALPSIQWQAAAQRLAISLAQRTSIETSTPGDVNSKSRLAFFRVDFSVSNAVAETTEDALKNSSHLQLRFPRIHAVLQPTAIEALGDLVDYFEEEIELRRKHRRSEVEAIRERVLKTFELSEGPLKSTAPSWISLCILSIEAQSLGVAIPLSDDGILAPDRHLRRAKSVHSRPAFLVTVPSVEFKTHRGCAASARIVDLAFQFVSDFDQGRKEDFQGPTHQSLNRILFPEMQCTMSAVKDGPMMASSLVSGIEIDLETSAVDFALSLAEVCRLSYTRFAKFVPQPSDTVSVFPEAPPRPCSTQTSQSSAIRATFEFESGTIRLHSKRTAWNRPVDASSTMRLPPRPKPSRRGRSLDGNQFRQAFSRPNESAPDHHVDVILIPGLSTWVEYQETRTEGDQSDLHVNLVIHGSRNTLYPTLIPFLSDVTRKVINRSVRFASSSAPPVTQIHILRPSRSGNFAPPPPATTKPVARDGLKVGISLRIDKSQLEISCLPAAEVTARLSWESGGFLVTTCPDDKGFDFAVTVDGVAAGIKHSFSPEDCFLAETKGLAAFVAFKAADPAVGRNLAHLSATIDVPDVSAEVNFRHFQDWLCLKAVWLDRVDWGIATPSVPTSDLVCVSQDTTTRPPAPRILTLALLEIRKVSFSLDLGQTIGKSAFIVETLSTRLRWLPGDSRRLSVGIKRIELLAQGRAGGSAALEGLLFETVLRDDEAKTKLKPSDLLYIQIGLGKLTASLEHEFHKILLIDADPIAVTVEDNWSRATTTDAELELSFKVKMGSFHVIATVATVPTVVSVSRRIQSLLAEKTSQANATIANSSLPPRTPRPDAQNAVAMVASALGSQTTPGQKCNIRILNRLDIEVDRIRIAVFPDHFNDGEVFRVDAGSTIRAQLLRGENADGRIKRELELFLGFFSIRKVNHKKVDSLKEEQFDVADWLALFRASTERNIFRVPTTEVSMQSEQNAGSNVIEHKFGMTYKGQVEPSLNYALLRTLGLLAASYQTRLNDVNSVPKVASSVATTAPNSPYPDATKDLALQTSAALTPSEATSSPSGPVELEYVAKEMNVMNPQLRYLGDATPPLDFLGVQTARFPGWIHQGVTLSLEELVLVLSSTYLSSLARQRVMERMGRPSSL